MQIKNSEKKSEFSEINSEFRDKLVRIRTCKLRIPRKSQICAFKNQIYEKKIVLQDVISLENAFI